MIYYLLIENLSCLQRIVLLKLKNASITCQTDLHECLFSVFVYGFVHGFLSQLGTLTSR